MKTAQGLVDFAKKALKENWGYCLGTYGNILTPSYLKQKQSQGYGVGAYNTRHNAYLQRFINKRVSDCYGLVKGYVWWQGEDKNPNYVTKQDRNQEGAYTSAKEKGPLSTLPEIPGIVLWMKGHAGIYIGNGEFIEIAGVPVGMRKGKISNGRVVSGSKFTHWFKDTYINYDEHKPSLPPIPSKPSTRKKTAIEIAQEVIAGKWGNGAARKSNLEKAGYSYSEVQKEVNQKLGGSSQSKPPTTPQIKVDGYWGPETTRALQKALGTVQDGVISRPSLVIKALQGKVGAKTDGYLGVETISKLQRYLKTPVDGKISKPSLVVKEMQRRLNNGTF